MASDQPTKLQLYAGVPRLEEFNLATVLVREMLCIQLLVTQTYQHFLFSKDRWSSWCRKEDCGKGITIEGT